MFFHKNFWKREKKILEDFFQKAGLELNVFSFEKRLFLYSIIITFLFWSYYYFITLFFKKEIKIFLSFTIITWTLIFILFWLLLRAFFYLFLEFKIYKRKKELEAVLPDFLQLVSANLSAGMPIDKALWTAIRPQFGVLAKEMELVAKETVTGVDLVDSLSDFVKKYDSKVLQRTVALLLEGLEAGGELADLLSKIAVNLQEINIMKKEMSANVTTYAIFITFASIIIAPVLFGLAQQLVNIILNIVSKLKVSGGLINFHPINDYTIIDKFRFYSYLMLSVTGGMSALIIGVIKKGHVKESIKDVPLYILVALLIFLLTSKLMASLFSGIA